MHFRFDGNDGMHEYSIHVADPAASSHFQMPYSLETGEKISFKSSPGYNKYENYKVQLKETVDMSGNGDCMFYPSERYASYSDCIEAEMRAKILPGKRSYIKWV